MHTTPTIPTTDVRLLALERSARRWRTATLALGGVVLAGLALGFANQPAAPSTNPARTAVDVQNGGFAVVQTQDGQFRVIYEAGQNVFRMTTPSN